MKGRFKPVFIFFLFIFLAVIAGIASGQQLKMMTVQVKEGQVRSAPTFIGGIVGAFSYGDPVIADEEKGDWIRVRMAGSPVKGWMHISALTKKKLMLRAGADVKQSATSDELALAGKGFSSEVEKAFKIQNPQLSFKWIDKMEKFAVTQSQMQQFLKAGGISPEGGAR
jgi:hypothetical protein